MLDRNAAIQMAQLQDSMRYSVALDVLRLPHHDDDTEDVDELRAAATSLLSKFLKGNAS